VAFDKLRIVRHTLKHFRRVLAERGNGFIIYLHCGVLPSLADKPRTVRAKRKGRATVIQPGAMAVMHQPSQAQNSTSQEAGQIADQTTPFARLIMHGQTP
jgi:hypothetical protein